LLISGQVKESDIVDLLEVIMVSPYVNGTIRQYVLTATAKLSTRFAPSSDQQARLRALLGRFNSSVEVELQQRAVEFGELLGSSVSAGVLERMPLPELKATVMGTVSERRAVGSTRTDKDVRLQCCSYRRSFMAYTIAQSLLDLMGDEGSTMSPVVGGPSKQTTQDLLADIFGSGDAPASASSAAAPAKSSVNDIMGLFGSDAPSSAPATMPPRSAVASPPSATSSLFDLDVGSPPAAAPAAPPATQYPAYEGHGLRVTIAAKRDAGNATVINLTATFTATAGPVGGIQFQAAVPKVRARDSKKLRV
jgi:AP-1 complex subunit gamma-1